MTQIATTNLELIQPLANHQALTDEQFMLLQENDNLYEYVDGELIIVANSGVEHGYLALTLGYFLTGFVRDHKLGVTCDSSTAFKMKTGNKRSPDLAFISKERLQSLKRLPKGFFDGAPDLAVEIISPNNTFEEIHNSRFAHLKSSYKKAERFNQGFRL